MLLSLRIARVKNQAFSPTAWVPRHEINDCLYIVRLDSRQVPELSDETQHPSSTDGGDMVAGKVVLYTSKSVYSDHHEHSVAGVCHALSSFH